MVNIALFTGLAGLRSHQTQIDVVGSNLANVSTPGYRGSRMTFSDILSFTVRPGSGPNGNFGGVNPMQIGLGSSVGSIDINTNQGTFQDTGRPFDVALQGQGFFTLTDGAQTYFSRVGTFGLDANRTLVDTRTGYRVLGADGANIEIPNADTLPAQATQNVTFAGSLPATVTGPFDEVVESQSPLLEGTAATTTSTAEPFDLSGFDGNDFRITVGTSAQQSVTINSADFANLSAATAAELANVINSQTTGVVATDNGGALELSTVTLGESATLKLDDGSGAGLVTQIGLNTTLVSGTQAAATGTTDIGMLTSRLEGYSPGDTISVSGTNPDGTPFSDTFVYGPAGAGQSGTTLAEMVTFINGLIATDANGPTATATLAANGTIEMRARDKGEASMSLSISDLTAERKNVWAAFEVTQQGSGPDTETAPMTVIDSMGRVHDVTLTVTRSEDDPAVWNLVAEMDESEGTIANNMINGITFNSDGSFNLVSGGNSTLDFTFDGIAATQSVNIDFGTSGAFDGVAMLESSTSGVNTNGDGVGPGTLLNVAFDNAGNLNGIYSNGQSRLISTLRISVFANEAGLNRAGDTMFTQSANSDDAIQTTAGSAGSGTIRAGSLENSNVDIAAEFVRLIEAQRGFQANSRIITTADEILSELVNIVR